MGSKVDVLKPKKILLKVMTIRLDYLPNMLNSQISNGKEEMGIEKYPEPMDLHLIIPHLVLWDIIFILEPQITTSKNKLNLLQNHSKAIKINFLMVHPDKHCHHVKCLF